MTYKVHQNQKKSLNSLVRHHSCTSHKSLKSFLISCVNHSHTPQDTQEQSTELSILIIDDILPFIFSVTQV